MTQPDLDSRAHRRTQQQRSSATRAALINSTIDLLVEKGHASITVEDIAFRAGVSRGAVQHHFETREDLWADTLREIMDQMDRDLTFPGVSKLSVVERIDIVLDRYWSVFGGPLFIAALEIRYFGRLNLAFRKRIQDEFEITRSGRDRIWIELFKDTELGSQHLTRLRILMLDLLRGFALRRITQGAESISKSEISSAKKMISSLLLQNDTRTSDCVEARPPKNLEPSGKTRKCHVRKTRNLTDHSARRLSKST
jgi:AcrR family transcriptional regulator